MPLEAARKTQKKQKYTRRVAPGGSDPVGRCSRGFQGCARTTQHGVRSHCVRVRVLHVTLLGATGDLSCASLASLYPCSARPTRASDTSSYVTSRARALHMISIRYLRATSYLCLVWRLDTRCPPPPRGRLSRCRCRRVLLLRSASRCLNTNTNNTVVPNELASLLGARGDSRDHPHTVPSALRVYVSMNVRALDEEYEYTVRTLRQASQ